jgi:hypothetical protein
MIYRIELRDRSMEFVTILDGRVANIQWGYSPVGGCSDFSFSALSKYCTELNFGANFNVRIYKRNFTTKAYDLVYQGRIENVEYSVSEDKEDVQVNGFGYQSELSDIIVNRNYTSTEISAIVKDILDNDVVPNTNVSYQISDLENTGFTPDSIKFSYVSALECFDKLADICGSREWGVNKNRQFFFKAQTEDIGWRYPIGGKLTSVKMNSSSREIANRIIVLGKEVSGSKYIYTKDYTQSQLKYKRRDKVESNSAVTTAQVAEELADAKYAEFKGVVDRASAELKDDVVFEETVPVKLFKIISREVRYNERNYNTLLYAGQNAFRIRKINYSIDDKSSLKINLELGQLLPDIVENIKQLKFSLNNEIQAGG